MIKIVISGPNCTEGGILNVMKDLLLEISKHVNFQVIAIVHSKILYEDLDIQLQNIKFIELPDSKSSWLKRIKYEYFDFKKLSLKIKPDIWLSMHDITPNVSAKFLATYCHNSSPFYRFSIKDFYYDKKFGLFTLLYKYLYQINIKKNNFVFVQQNWIKDEFEKMFNIKNVVVAKPDMKIDKENSHSGGRKNAVIQFFYPSFPRVFKNFEIICKAVEYLRDQLDEKEFDVYLTIDGNENKYARDIVQKYKQCKNIHFLGLLTRERVFNYYQMSDVLIFPSKLETWGLPVTEFKVYDKPILISDLSYAKETIGEYKKVNFFDPDDHIHLAKLMKQHIEGSIVFDKNTNIFKKELVGWSQFIKFLELEYKKEIKK